MRAPVLSSLLILASCSYLFPRLAPELCSGDGPIGCQGDEQKICREGFIVVEPCDVGSCADEAGAILCSACGDGFIIGAEACDDLNAVDGDGCSATCTIEPGFQCIGEPSVCFDANCGDGTLNPGEACDDGNNIDGDNCRADCLGTEFCGDGLFDPIKGEQCDDGNNIDADGCEANCLSPACANGIKDPGELCFDPANASSFFAGDAPQSLDVVDFENNGFLEAITANEGSQTLSIFFDDQSGRFPGQFTMNLSVLEPATISPSFAIARDLDGDQDLDVAVTDRDAGLLILLENTPQSFLSFNKSLATTGDPEQVIAVDVNNDLLLDLITANSFGDSIGLFLNQGSLNFLGPQVLPIGGTAFGVASGDFNEDGFIDLVSINNNTDAAVLFKSQSGTFQANNSQSFPIGDAPNNVEVGDIDNDGNLDIATANELSHDVTILFGDGLGGFSAPLSLPTASDEVFALTLVNLDADGLPDIAATSFTATVPGSIQLFTHTGPRVFGSPVVIPSTGQRPEGIKLADTNADGIKDIITAVEDEDHLSIYTGLNPGFSAPVIAQMTEGMSSLSMADFNGDGLFDALTSDRDSDTFSIHYGTGPGEFGVALSFFSGLTASDAAFGDLNGDGVLDVAVSNASDDSITLFFGDGIGFPNRQTISTGDRPEALKVLDLNGDGRLDLATADAGADTVTLLFQQVNGSFFPAAIPVGVDPFALSFIELNGDTLLDLVTADFSSDTVSVRLGVGAGNFGPLISTAVGAGPFLLQTGDLNGDSIADLVTANEDASISVLIGDGAGNFSVSTQSFGVSGSDEPTSILVTDIDFDQDLDLLLGFLQPSNPDLVGQLTFFQNSNGALTQGTSLVLDDHLSGLVVRDINGDTNPDIISSLNQGDGIRVFFGDP